MTDSVSRGIEDFFARHAGPAALRPSSYGTFPGLEAVPSGGGQHRNAMLQLTRFFRSQWMFSPEACAKYAQVLIEAGALADFNPGDPFLDSDLETMACGIHPEYRVSADPEHEESLQNVAEMGLPPSRTLPSSILGGEEDLQSFDRPLGWLIHRYVPRNALVMLYGEGKVGKSTFAAYVAGLALAKRTNVLFVGAGEETPELFYAKARASMKDERETGKFWFLRMPNFRLPTHAALLETVLCDESIGFVYFDAWRSHIDRSVPGHEADLTRTVLTPLADLASRLGVTILCTTHENVAGRIMGSSEVQNVARIVLHLTKESTKTRRVQVVASNFPEPLGSLSFGIEGTKIADRYGKYLREVVDGVERPVEVGYIDNIDVNLYPSINVDDVAEDEQERIRNRIRAMREADPTITEQECLNNIKGPWDLRRALFARDCEENSRASVD